MTIKLYNQTSLANELGVSQQYIQALVNHKKKSRWFIEPKYKVETIYAWTEEQVKQMKEKKNNPKE